MCVPLHLPLRSPHVGFFFAWLLTVDSRSYDPAVLPAITIAYLIRAFLRSPSPSRRCCRIVHIFRFRFFGVDIRFLPPYTPRPPALFCYSLHLLHRVVTGGTLQAHSRPHARPKVGVGWGRAHLRPERLFCFRLSFFLSLSCSFSEHTYIPYAPFIAALYRSPNDLHPQFPSSLLHCQRTGLLFLFVCVCALCVCVPFLHYLVFTSSMFVSLFAHLVRRS